MVIFCSTFNHDNGITPYLKKNCNKNHSFKKNE